MASIRIETRYSIIYEAGQCLEYVDEKALCAYVRDLMTDEVDEKRLEKKHKMLVAYLHSGDLKCLCMQSEQSLAERLRVFPAVSHGDGEPEYQLEAI